MKHVITSRTQQTQKIKTVILDYLDGLCMDASFSCVEVGCGSGEISTYFANFVAKIWRIEIEFNNFSTAQTSQNKELAFSQVAGAMLLFSNQVFNQVLSPQVYEHTTKQKEAFDKIYRVLKPGGIRFLTARIVFR